MLECWSCTFVLGNGGGVSPWARPGGLLVSGHVTCASWDAEQTGTFIIHVCNTTKGTTRYPNRRALGFYLRFFFNFPSLLLLRLQLKIHTATLLNINWTVRESFWKELLDMCAPLSGSLVSPNNKVGNRLYFREVVLSHKHLLLVSVLRPGGEKATPPIECAPFKDEGQRSVASAAWACTCGHVVSMYEYFAVRWSHWTEGFPISQPGPHVAPLLVTFAKMKHICGENEKIWLQTKRGHYNLKSTNTSESLEILFCCVEKCWMRSTKHC